MATPIAVTELHIHFEGSLALTSAIELAAARKLPWGTLTVPQLRQRLRFEDFGSFLMSVRDMAEVLSSIDALERGARELSWFLRESGLDYAEVYFSPYIYVRWGLDGSEVMRALERGFSSAEEQGGTRCAILLDSVRQWGPEAAATVLDIHEATRVPRVVGFGLGGEESVPLESFTTTYERARSLGLHGVVHAGEVGNPSEVGKAIETLGVERVAHGFRILDDRGVLDTVRNSGVPLDLALTSNYRTGVVRGPHPIRRLIDEGIPVTLSTDDPSLFRIDLPREYRRARRIFGISDTEIVRIASDGIRFSFADEKTKSQLDGALAKRLSKSC